MSKATLVGFGVGAVLVAIGTQACSIASDTYITAQQGVKQPKDDAGASAGEGAGGGASGETLTCKTDDYVKPDLSKLPVCGDGKGHCYDKTKVDMGEKFGPCPSDPAQVCVPNEILEAEGKPLKKCKAIIGEGGGCATATLIPEVEAQGGLKALQKDVCADHELCMPCIDPTNGGAATPFCAGMGVHENACSAGAAGDAAKDGVTNAPKNEPCCGSAGECWAETSIPEDQREGAPSLTCKGGNKCVPIAISKGEAVKCAGNFLSGPGLCMNECFSGMMKVAGMIGALSREGCQEQEVCVPCSELKKRGAPGCD